MKALVRLLFIISFAGLFSCEKETGPVIKYHMDALETNKYYLNEVLPEEYQEVYGKWKLFKVSGGLAGKGYEPDFDYLEIKRFGIYGLVRNDSLFEYGRIELDTFDVNTSAYLQIKLIPDFYSTFPAMYPPEKYMDIKRSDTLDLFSPCCDMFNYHFSGIK